LNRLLQSYYSQGNFSRASFSLWRELLPQVVLVPSVVTGLVLWGFRNNYFAASLGFILLGLVNVLILSLIVIRSARSLKLVEKQRRIGELARQDLEVRLSRIMANAPLIIYSINGDGIVTSAQGKGLETLGLSPNQLIGRHILKIFPKDPEFQTAMERAISGESFRTSVSIKDRIYEVQHVPNPKLGGGFDLSVGIAFDITQTRLAEDNLRMVNSQLFQMTQKAEDASLAKSQFLASMSHEIRTPLNTILGIADLLSETNLDDVQKRYVDVYKKSSQHLLELIDNTLDLLQIEAGEAKLECRPFSFKHLIESMAEWATLSAQMKSLEFKFTFDSYIESTIKGDARRIRQILFNVLANAFKFTEKGQVSLEAKLVSREKDIQNVMIVVTDTGIGIEKDKQNLVFDEFNQADRSITRRYGGSGLGLAITKRLIGEMRGTIQVESNINQGTEIRILLPFPVSDEVPAKDELPANVRRRAEGPNEETSGKILVAEDLEDNRFLLKSYFRGSPYEVEFVENGKLALEKVKTNNYDIVLMDIHMPVMDGCAAIHEIREWEKSLNKPELPIIALTAHALVDEVNMAKKVGCSVYLTKPIRKSVLLNEIDKQLHC
jgi:PAS domain S-box-containing protein